MQKLANLVELEKYCEMSLQLKKLMPIQPRTDIPKVGLSIYRYTGITVPEGMYTESVSIWSSKTPERHAEKGRAREGAEEGRARDA